MKVLVDKVAGEPPASLTQNYVKNHRYKGLIWKFPKTAIGSEIVVENENEWTIISEIIVYGSAPDGGTSECSYFRGCE